MPIGIAPRRPIKSIKVPIRHFAYFYAQENQEPLHQLAAALEQGDAESVRRLLKESEKHLDQSITEKELQTATTMQHSQRQRAVQELVQNSMDAYGPEGGPMWYRQHQDPKKGRVFEFKDQAGGLPSDDFLGLLMTIGASRKREGSVGGHGQGFKAMFGVGKNLAASSRKLHAEIAHDGTEWVAEFSPTPQYVNGLHVRSEGVDPQLNLADYLQNYCQYVEPHFAIHRTELTSEGPRHVQINTVQRQGNPDFVPIGKVGKIKVYAQPTIEDNTHTTWLQNGLHIVRQHGNNPLNIFVEMPGGAEHMLERGRDNVPYAVEQKVRKQLKPMIRAYARQLLEKKTTLTPREIAFLKRATPISEKVLRYVGAAASAAAVMYGGATAASMMGGALELAGETHTGTLAPGIPQPQPPIRPEGPTPTGPKFQDDWSGFMGVLGSSVTTGLVSERLYHYLLQRQEAGKSNSLPALLSHGAAALWRKFRGDVPFAIRRMKLLPVLEKKDGATDEGRISIQDAVRLHRKEKLRLFINPREVEDGPDGVYLHNNYAGPAELDRHHEPMFRMNWSPTRWIRATAEHASAKSRLKAGKADGQTRLLQLVQIIAKASGQTKFRTGFARHDEGTVTHGNNRLVVNLDHPVVQKIVDELDRSRITDKDLVDLCDHVIESASDAHVRAPEHGYRYYNGLDRQSLFSRFKDVETQINQAGIQIVRRDTQ